MLSELNEFESFNLSVISLKHCKLQIYIQYFGTLVRYLGTFSEQLVKLTCKFPCNIPNLVI